MSCVFLLQPDLTVKRSGSSLEYVGFAELDETLGHYSSKPSQLASMALQFIFNGYSGFTFPAAHYPVKGVSAEELNHLTHRLVLALEMKCFTVVLYFLTRINCVHAGD